MAAPAMPYTPSKKSQEAILAFLRQSYSLLNQQFNIRDRLLQLDLAYMREVDWTEEQYKARVANRVKGDPTKFQNVIVPTVFQQVESAVTYQASVFLQGYPFFGVVADPTNMDAALQMETVIGEQQTRGKWANEFIKAFRDGFKYNLFAVECDWERQVTFSLDTDVNYRGGQEGRPKEITYQYNKIKHLDMYNTFFDTRCTPQDIPEYGEFAGKIELMSLIRLRKFLQSLPVRINYDEALQSGLSAPVSWGSNGVESYYLPQINPAALLNLTTYATTDWFAWAGLANQMLANERRFQNMYQVTTIYGRICPSDFGFKGVPGPNIPQVWKFIIVNNQVVVFAERLTNAHQLIPILFGQPLDDGLSYQTKSFADNILPFQEIMSALTNSSIAARRRAISDRIFYDSSRIAKSDINSDSPTAKIPVKPHAFGSELSKAVLPVPFQDNQFQFNAQEIQLFGNMANQTSGLNPARQGQFVKGNKTRFEFAEIMGNANGRDQLVAMTLESNFFTPLKEIIKSNILQYQPEVVLVNRESQQAVSIDPLTLRKAQFEFKVSDGLIPSEKLIDGESLALAFQSLGTIPALANGYNLPAMFSYIMKSRGARLQPFEKSQEQLAYEQAVAQWQQAVTILVEQLSKLTKEDGSSYTLEEIQKALPPQPLPEQFGYDPRNPIKSLTTPSTGTANRPPVSDGGTQLATGI